MANRIGDIMYRTTHLYLNRLHTVDRYTTPLGLFGVRLDGQTVLLTTKRERAARRYTLCVIKAMIAVL